MNITEGRDENLLITITVVEWGLFAIAVVALIISLLAWSHVSIFNQV